MRRLLHTGRLVALLMGVTAGSAHAQNREHLQMAAELRMLQEQQQQLAVALAQLADALKTLNGRVDARFDEAATLTRKGIADQGQDLRHVVTDMGAIRERVQETDTRIRTLGDEVEALRLTVAALPNMIAQAAQVAALGAVAALTAPPAPASDPGDPSAPPAGAPAPLVVPPAPLPLVPAPPSTTGLSPNRIYETAYGDYASGQWTLAIGGFEQLVRTFPQSERADDAQFFIGEALVALNRFPDAIAAYNLAIQNYPKGDQAHLALYKRGLTQERLKQFDAAKASYGQAIKLYPDSVGAVMSKPGLDRIERTLGALAAPVAPR